MRNRSLIGRSLTAVIIIGLVVALAPGALGKPLNAGKNGTKSNAGAGNGAEAGALIDTTITGTEILSYGEVKTVDDPNDAGTTQYLPKPADILTLQSRVQVGATYHANPNNNNSALKANFVETYSVQTWDGQAWVTTYLTVQVQDVVKQDAITSTFEDIDPGSSQEHNQAPEADTVEEQSVSDPYTVTEVLGPGAPVVEEGGGFTPVAGENEVIETSHPCEGANAASCS